MTFRNKLIFYGDELFPRPTPKLGTTACWLSATAYSVYSQLPFISGVRILHPQPEDAPSSCDKPARESESELDYEFALPEYGINTERVGLDVCAVGKYTL
jgi:hypothetical protein